MYGIMVRLGLSLVVVLVDRLSTLQAETIDFYNRTFTSGGIINQSDLLAIDKFIVDGKSGWWQAQKICVFFKTNGGVASAIIKLKHH
jgi:hypothetical protein